MRNNNFDNLLTKLNSAAPEWALKSNVSKV